MAGHDIIVVGASAGGVLSIRRLLSLLPANLPAAVFIVLHHPGGKGAEQLPSVLGGTSDLPATRAIDGEHFQHGGIYISQGDSHLLLERGVIRIEQSPKESHSRPSIDALFRSAALAYGRRVVGVLLSGAASDGTVGLWQIRKRGGVAVVQDPCEANHTSMPASALANVPVDYCLAIAEIARKLVELAREEPSPAPLSGAAPARVLIVEDERVVAMSLESRLRDLGYDIAGSVASGEAALEAAAAAMPDIVLMDIYLAGPMTGTEAASILWQRYQLPVVYLTAYADEKTLNAAKTSTPYGYIVKPYRPEQIHAALQVALDRYEREMHIG